MKSFIITDLQGPEVHQAVIKAAKEKGISIERLSDSSEITAFDSFWPYIGYDDVKDRIVSFAIHTIILTEADSRFEKVTLEQALHKIQCEYGSSSTVFAPVLKSRYAKNPITSYTTKKRRRL
jgi:hypothetical protein